MALANLTYQPLLTRGHPTPLGSISALNTPLQFAAPIDSATYRGQLTIHVPTGAVTTPTWLLEGSIDGGATWFVITAATYTLTGLFTGDTAPIFAARYDISGLGAGAIFKFGLTAGTAITALSVFAHVG